jgi:hypothetical protein
MLWENHQTSESKTQTQVDGRKKFIMLAGQHLDISKMVLAPSSGWLGILYLKKQQQASREYRSRHGS